MRYVRCEFAPPLRATLTTPRSNRVPADPAGTLAGVKVVLRNPKRELDVDAPPNVDELLRRLDVVPESVLVIRNDELVTRDARLRDDDVVEIRPVVSGGAAP